MKIGLSFSRCVRDIVEGHVDIDDVLVIIARTDFDPNVDTEWGNIWAGYSQGSYLNTYMEWGNSDYSEEEFRTVSKELWHQGKLHQPRKFGAYARRLPYHWLETVLCSEDLEDKPAVKDAWNKFQVLAGLTNVDLQAQNKNLS